MRGMTHVKYVLKPPKMNRITPVTMHEITRPVSASLVAIYGTRGMSPPIKYDMPMVRAEIQSRDWGTSSGGASAQNPIQQTIAPFEMAAKRWCARPGECTYPVPPQTSTGTPSIPFPLHHQLHPLPLLSHHLTSTIFSSPPS